VLDGFAQTTGLLADERRAIEDLVKNLASLATTGLDLTSEHAAKLDHDLTVLTRTLQSVNVNIDGVRNILDATPLLVAGPDLDGTEGLAGAWDPDFHRLDLRNQVSPTVAQLFLALGLPVSSIVCLPVDVNCVPGPPTTTSTAPTATTAAAAPASAQDAPTAGGGGRWLHKLARSLAEVFS
jgi:hypothetical protein